MNAVDLFCGGGGVSLGLHQALGVPPILAINHNRAAIEMHAANHPNTIHLEESIFDVDPNRVLRPILGSRKKLDLIWLSPDCFAAGTLVLTRSGYKPIEEVQIGEQVWTHRQRWRPVIETMRSQKPIVKVHVQGHPDGLTCSDQHKHYAARSKGGDVERIPSLELGRGCYVGTPLALSEELIPHTPFTPWVLGRFVADGWASPEKGIVLTIGKSKADEVEDRLKLEIATWKRRETRTAIQFTTYSANDARWLKENFGHRAENKRIPGWILTAPESYRREFLAGYVAGDGYINGGLVETTTISRHLAIGLRTLAASFGYTVTAYAKKQRTNMIEGRRVQVHEDVYSIKWRETICNGRAQTFDREGQRFYPVRSVEGLNRVSTVYNLTVEEDASYVVEGITTWNCTHFSRARGAAPRSQGIRTLAWSGIEWARAHRPRLLFLENVPEFLGWGPLAADGQPDPARKGETFRDFVSSLKLLGYHVDWRVLSAADYGAPTSRRRLFLIAHLDRPPVWPAPTHGPGRPRPWRTAAECIDWSIPCPSIFERKKELAEATQRRIAEGIRRFVLESASPFIVRIGHQSSDAGKVASVGAPLSTITTKNEHVLITPFLTRYHGERREGERPRVEPLDESLPTVTTEPRFGLVAAFLAKHYTGAVGSPLDAPLGTVTAVDHHSLIAAAIVRHQGKSIGQSVDAPLSTVMSGSKHSLVAAFLTKYYGTGSGKPVSEPIDTITSVDRFGLVTVTLNGESWTVCDIGMRMLTPRELARAQGFPDDYILTGTQREQVARIGNSVPPPVVAAVVAANLNPLAEATK